MSCVHVPLGARAYDIHIEAGVLARGAERILAFLQPTGVAIVTHPHLAGRYATPLAAGFERYGIPCKTLLAPAGERTKSLASARRLYSQLLGARIDRQGLLIALGGGVIGDLGGFAAATWLRGIDFGQAPTTLLAQVDASVGGKTGVDLPGGKNLVGAFHQPRAVLIDTDTLDTLPARELRAGLAEVIKYGIIRDNDLFARLRADIPRLLRRQSRALADCILRSCEIKAEIVASDETEQGMRAVLNYGHTVGHALEMVTGYRRYKHGEAVAIGMVSAALVGEEMGVTPASVACETRDILAAAGLPIDFPSDVDAAAVVAAMSRDKKTIGGSLTFVLASGIGSVNVTPAIPPDLVRRALRRQGAK